MKTFQQFCENAYQLNEFNIRSLGGKITRNFGADIAGEGIKKIFRNNPIINKAVDVGTAGVGLGKFAPLATGVVLGTDVLAPAALKLAQQRREAQQRRLTQLVPSGKYSVSGKPAQIVPTRK